MDQLPLELGDPGSPERSPATKVIPYIRPFLKWAGGKYLLLDRIFSALPAGKRLLEPFTGSAVVAINAKFNSAIAADSNIDLINLYNSVRSDPESLIKEVGKLFDGDGNTASSYYRNRQDFNETSDAFRRSALFIYLNRHCFNGLCRYNSRGHFNVPFGRYHSPLLPEDAIRSFSVAAQRVEFRHADFRSVMESAERGDVVYCDPPYVPLSETANFTDYASDGFGYEEQAALAECAERLADRGITVVISNHDTPWVRALYQNAKISDGFGVQRRISRDAATRGEARELLAIFS